MPTSLDNLFSSSELKSTSPAGEIMAFHKGNVCTNFKWGKKYKYYDISSLTKIVFTNHLLIQLVKQKEINLNKEVRFYLPYMHKGVKVSELLNHTAGYSWWKPFYKRYPSDLANDLRWSHLKSMIVKEGRNSKLNKAIYSDIDYFILGFLLEEVYQEPLCNLQYYLPNSFHFNIENQPKENRHFYAPTENCLWRKRRLQGEVHDQNAWALGGVAPHAGLFSSMKSLSEWFLDFRKLQKRDPVWRKFTKRSIAKAKGDWALGFMMPSDIKPSAGQFFSKKSIGHTGFSGTSLWYDPVADLGVIILTNRLYNGVNNKGHIRLRPLVHDAIYKRVIFNET